MDNKHGHRELKRPPAMGDLKRTADAQALTLRAELQAVMRIRQLSTEDVARLSRLDETEISAFLAGSSLNPRWQTRLTRWLENAIT
jgi:hypothetical protein